MTEAREYSAPKALTPEQRLVAAHMHIIGGVAIHTIAGSFGVNSGRVAEAVTAVRRAIEDPRAFLGTASEEKIE